MHAKLSIRSFYEHVVSDANAVNGFSREVVADELAQAGFGRCKFGHSKKSPNQVGMIMR